MNPNGHIFISYRSLEREFALKLATDLRISGVAVWMDHLDGIRKGDDWRRSIEQGLLNAAGLIAVLSPDYVGSKYCLRELATADELNTPILPIIYRQISNKQYPIEIRRLQSIDFQNWRDSASYKQQFEQLIAIIKDKSAAQLGEIPDLEQRYLHRLIAGLESRRGVVEYVELTGRTEIEESRPRAYFDVEDEFGYSELSQNLEKPIPKKSLSLGSIRDALEKHFRFVLIGEAGSSKTTTIRHLALESARKRLNDPTAPLPMLLYLPRWSTEATLQDFVRSQWHEAELPTHVDPIALLKSGDVHLYLDGLNEMGGLGVENAKKLKGWLSSPDSARCVIVTCRRDNYVGDFELGLPIVQIEPMSEEHVRKLVWSYLPTKAEALLKRILPSDDTSKQDKRHLYQLARNPYMLTALIIVFSTSSDEELPHNNGKLFQLLVRALAKREAQRHSLAWIPVEDRYPAIESALAKLAFAMIDEAKGTEVSLSYAKKYLNEDIIHAAQDADYLEVNNDQVRFYHQMMQEFFAAIELQRIKSMPAYPRSIWKAFSALLRSLDPTQRAYEIRYHHYREMLRYLGLIPRPTKLESLTHSYNGFFSNGETWEEVIKGLCGIENDPNETIQQLAEINPYLAVQCTKNTGFSSATDIKIASKLKPYLTRDWYGEALSLLGDFGTDLATDAIIEFLTRSHDDSVRREHAVQALGKTKNRRAIHSLLQSIEDKDGEVRWFAALSIAKMPDVPIAELVHLFIESDFKSNVHSTAKTALVRTGKLAIPQLVARMMENNDISTQRELASILVEISPTVEAIPALLKIMTDTDENGRSIRQAAVDRLGELNAVSEMAGLFHSLDDWSMKMRVSGRLQAIGTSDALAAVEQWRSSES